MHFTMAFPKSSLATTFFNNHTQAVLFHTLRWLPLRFTTDSKYLFNSNWCSEETKAQARTDAARRASRVLTAGLCILSSQQQSEKHTAFFLCVRARAVQFSAQGELSLMRSQDVSLERDGAECERVRRVPC